jgi:hypothetical protein
MVLILRVHLVDIFVSYLLLCYLAPTLSRSDKNGVSVLFFIYKKLV